MDNRRQAARHPAKTASRKGQDEPEDAAPAPAAPTEPDRIPDSLAAWMERYQALAVAGVRSQAVADKIALHLARFREFYRDSYGHERLSACTRRDVLAWQRHLADGMSLVAASVNSNMASPSASYQRLHQPHGL